MAAPTTWNRLSFAVLLLLLAAGFVMAFLWYIPEIELNRRLQAERMKRMQDIAALQQEIDGIRFRLGALDRNPKAVERLARWRLGYARPGETVLYFRQPLPAVTEPPIIGGAE
ncbi:MAG: septum formation initiator family protein [Verrucomicrobiales bacterium]|nr:septum formation initiator family protein [Verrucomicrobiales bacterium]